MSEFDTNLDARTVSTMEETDKKCPNCGGVMDFDPKTGGLLCPYCGHTQEIAAKTDEPKEAAELSLILRKTQKTATGVRRRKP